MTGNRPRSGLADADRFVECEGARRGNRSPSTPIDPKPPRRLARCMDKNRGDGRARAPRLFAAGVSWMIDIDRFFRFIEGNRGCLRKTSAISSEAIANVRIRSKIDQI
jgi:hypothetical protein